MQTTTPWHAVNDSPGLYLYKSSKPAHNVKFCPPILMLHSTLSGLASWATMSEYFTGYGLDNLYALEIPELQQGKVPASDFPQLYDAIEMLLGDLHPEHNEIILIGHGSGALMSYRYWQHYQEKSRLAYLFMIGAPHNTTVFPLLPEDNQHHHSNKPFDPTVTQSLPVEFTKIRSLQRSSNTVLVNIMGHQVSPDFYGVVRGIMHTTTHFDRTHIHDINDAYDGLVQGLRLPEAVNVVVTMRQQVDHRRLNKDRRVFETILSSLRGEYHQVKLRLVGLRMLGVDKNGVSGPIMFEVDGNQMPPDSIFQGIPERLYLFEESVPPLCTLRYKVGEISCTITLHLKDLSNQRGKRRRMYTKLFIPLRNGTSIAHTMQDSEGSDYIWRITCDRMPRVLDDPDIPDIQEELTRGI